MLDLKSINMVGFSVVLRVFITEADALYGEVYNASNQPLSKTSYKMDSFNTSVIIVYLYKAQIKNMLKQRRSNYYC